MAHSNGLLNFSTSNLLTPLGVNQTLLQDPNLSGRSLTSSLHLSPPAPLDSPIGLDNTPLEQLSSKYAAVAQVIQFRDSLSQQISRTTNHISNLYDDLNKLREENKLLQHQLSSLATSPVAQLAAKLLDSKKPAQRPEELPVTILWKFEDTRSDFDAAPSASNPSRAPLEMILRELDGRVAKREVYTTMLSAVHIAWRTHLEKIEGPKPGRPATLQYLRTNHEEAVNATLEDIEGQVIQAGWCFGHWKTLHFLQHHVQNRSNSAGKRDKRSNPQPDQLAHPLDNPATEPAPIPQPEQAGATLNAVPPPSAHRKRKTPEPEGDDKLSTIAGAQNGGDPPAKKSKPADSNCDKSLSSFNSALALGGNLAGASDATAVNTSHIRVDPSYENIKATLLSEPEYASIEDIKELLDRLKTLAAKDQPIPPVSDIVIAFLSRIEDADPNAPGLSEDDTNLQWGHYQFTASNMTISQVLTSWDSIGGVPIACRFLAAAIKTHRVAEYICFQRGVEGKPSLSLVYLSLIVQQIWGLVKDLADDEDHDNAQIDASDTTPASREEVNRLNVTSLNDWINANKIPKAASKRLKKDLVDLIMASASIPSKAFVAMVVKSTKDARKKL
ncbi:hypothetical protein FA13DRAFT_1893070 [Coprinellus micaceus]|uniref:Uncharacterized protein n=1 Tax=Coprinellus micaceus TaxID=71717 RepID=A0A4Y7TR54_COPMI|nr:hypothetical protein FA13DRAFT_1893070 [Coprinellus micaceus]